MNDEPMQPYFSKETQKRADDVLYRRIPAELESYDIPEDQEPAFLKVQAA